MSRGCGGERLVLLSPLRRTVPLLLVCHLVCNDSQLARIHGLSVPGNHLPTSDGDGGERGDGGGEPELSLCLMCYVVQGVIMAGEVVMVLTMAMPVNEIEVKLM